MSYAFINMDGNYMLELDDEILIEANAVAQLERERIIKLLEDNDFYISGHCHQGPDCCYPGEKLIALIKGEQE